MGTDPRGSAAVQSGLILAGGESARFGKPKALVPFRGRPMVRWVADALSPRSEELFVSVGTSDQADMLRAILPGAEFVCDVRPGRGPIEGFFRGFEAAQGDVVLVAPCDAPLLRRELYDLLIEALGRHDAAVPRLDVIDPIRAVYRREAVLRVLAMEEPASPSSLVDSLQAIFLGPNALRSADPSLSSFLDVNREADLAHVTRASQD